MSVLEFPTRGPAGPRMTEVKLLTPSQVANRLQMNERTVTMWLRMGHLRGFKLSIKKWLVSSRDLEAFLEQSANRSPSVK